MSRQNKVNKGNYEQAGRLTPDDMARERDKQRQAEHEIEHKVPDAKGAARTFSASAKATARPRHSSPTASDGGTVRGKRGQESTRARSAPEE